MKAPKFIIKKCIKKASFKNVMEGAERVGFEIQIANKIGSGTVVGLSTIRIDEREYPIDKLILIKDGKEHSAADVGESQPVSFKFGDEMTLRMMDGKGLDPGKYRIMVGIDFVGLGEVEVDYEDEIVN